MGLRLTAGQRIATTYPTAKAAYILGVSQGAVYRLRHAARAKLRAAGILPDDTPARERVTVRPVTLPVSA
jgi:hypothetical protein